MTWRPSLHHEATLRITTAIQAVSLGGACVRPDDRALVFQFQVTLVVETCHIYRRLPRIILVPAACRIVKDSSALCDVTIHVSITKCSSVFNELAGNRRQRVDEGTSCRTGVI